MNMKSIAKGVEMTTIAMALAFVFGAAMKGVSGDTSGFLQIFLMFSPIMISVGLYAYKRREVDSPKHFMLAVLCADINLFLIMVVFINAIGSVDEALGSCGFAAAILIDCLIADIACTYYEKNNEFSSDKRELTKIMILSSFCPLIGGIFAEKMIVTTVAVGVIQVIIGLLFVKNKRLYLFILPFTYTLFAVIGFLIADSLGWVVNGFMSFSGLGSSIFVLSIYLIIPIEAFLIVVKVILKKGLS